MSTLHDWVQSTPIWALSLGLFALMFVAAVAGSQISLRMVSRTPDTWTGNDAQEGYALSAVLGLLALMVGFTYALAVDRFEERRRLVLDEANAVSVAFFNTQLLVEPYRERGSRLLISYTENKIALARATSWAQAASLSARDEHITAELWTLAAQAYPSIRDYDFSTAYLNSINRVIELDLARKASRALSVPSLAIALLVIYLIAAAGMLGFVMKGSGGRFVSTFLLVLLNLSIMLVIDIDRPVSGAVNESQMPMEVLRDTILARSPVQPAPARPGDMPRADPAP